MLMLTEESGHVCPVCCLVVFSRLFPSDAELHIVNAEFPAVFRCVTQGLVRPG